MCLQRSPLVWPRATGSPSPRRAKYLEEDTLGLEALQPIEIPQNGQSFLWKSLEKNSRDLEKLGEKLGGGGAPRTAILPHRRAPCRARVLDRADERHRDRLVESGKSGPPPIRAGAVIRLEPD